MNLFDEDGELDALLRRAVEDNDTSEMPIDVFTRSELNPAQPIELQEDVEYTMLNEDTELKESWDFVDDDEEAQEDVQRYNDAGWDPVDAAEDSDEEEYALIREAEAHYRMLLDLEDANEQNADKRSSDNTPARQGMTSLASRIGPSYQLVFEETNENMVRTVLARQQRQYGNDTEISTLEELMASFGGVEYAGDPRDPLDMGQAEFRKTFFGDKTWFCEFERMLCGLAKDLIQPHDEELVKPEHLNSILSMRDEFGCILPLTLPTEVTIPVMACNYVGRQFCSQINPNVPIDNPFEDMENYLVPVPRALLAAITWGDHSPKENQSGPTKIISENPHGTIIVFSQEKATLWGLRSHEAEQAASVAPFHVLARETGVVCIPHSLRNANQQLSGMFGFTRLLQKLAFLCPYAIMDDRKIANARILRPGDKKKFMSLWGTNRFGVYGITETRHQMRAIRFLIEYVRQCCVDPVETKRLLQITVDGKTKHTNKIDKRRWRQPGPNSRQRLRRRVQNLKSKDVNRGNAIVVQGEQEISDERRGRGRGGWSRRGRGRGRGRGRRSKNDPFSVDDMNLGGL